MMKFKITADRLRKQEIKIYLTDNEHTPHASKFYIIKKTQRQISSLVYMEIQIIVG
jgi:hypothetical protein